MPHDREVVLVNMPFANLRWPNLGLSLLAAGVKSRGVACRVLYLNYDLAEQIGYDSYQWIADHFAFTLGGERLFSEAYFGALPTGHDAYLNEVLRSVDPDFSPQDAREYLRLFGEVEEFLDRAAGAYPWDRALVVGFATTFQQTMPSLALARRIKQACPHATVVFGGAACEDEMGITLAAQFPEIDYVFLGEADYSFPEFVAQLVEGQKEAALPAGVVSRKMAAGYFAAISHSSNLPVCQPGAGCPTGSGAVDLTPTLVSDLDALPYPDFDDFFDRYDKTPLRAFFEPVLFFEMSRGCWWGQKHHCTFCGLNGQSMRFRAKSPRRILDELHFLTGRYPVSRGCAADNILDYRAFRSLLPELEAAQLPFHFACELKANLTREQVGQLLRAGLGAAQLGIETFDSRLLKGMNKGADGYQNLQTLKWFTEAAVPTEWNWLYGFPEETPETYERLAQLVPAITHFAPPMACGRARMDRFSPFFQDPARFGMVRPRASRAFRHVYPFPQEVLNRLAYYYEFDYADGRDVAHWAQPLVVAVSRWREIHPHSRLVMRRAEDGSLLITDTRPEAGFRQHRLRGWQADLYVFCDSARSRQAIETWRATYPGVTWDECEAFLNRCCRDHLAVFWDDRFLSLAVWVPEQSELYQAARNVEQRIESRRVARGQTVP